MYYKYNHTLHKSKQAVTGLKDTIFFISQENIDKKINTGLLSQQSCISALEYLSESVTTQELSGSVDNLTPLGVQELWNAVSEQSDMSTLSNDTCPPPYGVSLSMNIIP